MGSLARRLTARRPQNWGSFVESGNISSNRSRHTVDFHRPMTGRMAAACRGASDAGREWLVPLGERRNKNARRNADADAAREGRRAFPAGPRPMTDGTSFDRVLALLYETALDDSLWPMASAAIDEARVVSGNDLAVVRRSDQGATCSLRRSTTAAKRARTWRETTRKTSSRPTGAYRAF